MPRPDSKAKLLAANDESFRLLNDLIDGLSIPQQKATFPFKHRDRNIRDVLGHLYHWQIMLLKWYEVGMGGGKPAMPTEGYTWKDTPQLNQEIWEQCQATSLATGRKQLQQTHSQVETRVKAHTDAQLFTKRHYHWTGSTSLGSYIVSATCSHYQWSIKLVKKFVKTLE